MSFEGVVAFVFVILIGYLITSWANVTVFGI